MPIYEYEPLDHDCLMCPNRVAAIQSVDEPHLEFCPDCGMPVRRVVTSASFKVASGGLNKAGDRGFTTWKKVETGKWEKVSGQGADLIVGDPSSIQEPPKKKPLEL